MMYVRGRLEKLFSVHCYTRGPLLIDTTCRTGDRQGIQWAVSGPYMYLQ